MGAIAPFLVPIAFFFSVAAVFILRGPFGKALAERMLARSSGRNELPPQA
ncbi:MAG: hypothetical protein ACE5HT_01550 [Gemmatimonadales bacterium]